MRTLHERKAPLAACILALCMTFSSVGIAGGRSMQQKESGPRSDDVASLEWLESPKDPRALAWAREQTRRSRAELEKSPEYASVRASLLEHLKASAPIPYVTLAGSRAFRLQRDADHPFGRLQIAERTAAGVNGWKTVLDIAALRKEEGKPYELQWASASDSCLPPEFDRCLLDLSPGGGDAVELREFDVRKAHFVKDGFRVPASRARAVWLGRDQLLVAHTLFGSPVTAAGWAAAVRIWHRGEPLEAAKTVFRASPEDSILELYALGHGPARRAVAVRAIDYSTYDMTVITQRGKVIPLDLPTHLKPTGVLATTDHDLVVQLAEDAMVEGKHYAAETLLSVDTLKAGEAGGVRAIFTPPADEYLSDTLTGVTATHDGVYFVVTRGGVPHVLSALPAGSGWVVHEELAAAAGQSIQIRRSGNPTGNDLVVRTMGLITPAREEIWSHGSSPLLIASETPVMDTSRFVVEARSAVSSDKTRIDYVLLRPREARNGAPIPTLMTGYGAFGITLRFGYFDRFVGGRSLALWLARGGALVIPAARGGGERGENWHRVAMREHRQLSYDDFEAVAESLVKSGFTTPAHFGIFGSSNGGLMAATMGTQRPDLFGAVVSDVPLTDMLRFPKMGMGSAWIDEYGNPDKPEEAAALRAYSPLHNVRANVKYPPFLITSSTEDNRVGPGHARKLAARLLEVGARVYLIEDQEGGHAVSDALERTDNMAARMTFLIDALMPHERP